MLVALGEVGLDRRDRLGVRRAVAVGERAQRRRRALEGAAARIHDVGERRHRVVVAEDQRRDGEHVGGDGRAAGVRVAVERLAHLGGRRLARRRRAPPP